jgi:hypothetical protein
MANIYADAGMQHDADKVEALRVQAETWKRAESSIFIDANGNVHSFRTGDGGSHHSQAKEIKLLA